MSILFLYIHLYMKYYLSNIEYCMEDCMVHLVDNKYRIIKNVLTTVLCVSGSSASSSWRTRAPPARTRSRSPALYRPRPRPRPPRPRSRRSRACSGPRQPTTSQRRKCFETWVDCWCCCCCCENHRCCCC